jgi:hypothetical protein
MEVPPAYAPPVHVEAAVFIDAALQDAGELLSQAWIESGLLHIPKDTAAPGNIFGARRQPN